MERIFSVLAVSSATWARYFPHWLSRSRHPQDAVEVVLMSSVRIFPQAA